MTDLREYQEELRHRLTVGEQRHALVRAPVGSGITEVLVHVAADRVRAGELVVILTPHRIVVEQFADRLARHGVDLVQPIVREEQLLALSETPGGFGAGVLICSLSLLHRPLARRVLSSLSPTLLIVDGLQPLARSKLGTHLLAMVAVADQVVATTNVSGHFDWLNDAEVLDIVPSLASPALPGDRTLTVRAYSLTDAEQSAFETASRLLSEATGRSVRPASRPALLAALLRAANQLPLPPEDLDTEPELDNEPVQAPLRPGLRDEIWAAADALEELGVDSRGEALVAAIRHAPDRQRLVRVDTVEELRYVSEILSERGIPTESTSSMVSKMDRDKALAAWNDASVLVATNRVLESIDQLPPRTLSVWWSPPTTRAAFERRLAGNWGDGSTEIVVLVSEPALPRDLVFMSDVLPWVTTGWWGSLRVSTEREP